jgi:hypothetical protein
MLESLPLQFVVFVVGVLYLALHAGPLLRLWYEPSIRGGTRWQFFGSEVALFIAWFVAFPQVAHSLAGQTAVGLHVATHASYTTIDKFAHDFLLRSALSRRQSEPLMWFAKEFGLLMDTATHAFVVVLTASVLPLPLVLGACLLAVPLFAWITKGYLRDFAVEVA